MVNLVLENGFSFQKGNIMADNLEFDLSLKTLNISMFSKNQINVKLKDQ